MKKSWLIIGGIVTVAILGILVWLFVVKTDEQ